MEDEKIHASALLRKLIDESAAEKHFTFGWLTSNTFLIVAKLMSAFTPVKIAQIVPQIGNITLRRIKPDGSHPGIYQGN